MSTSLSSYWGGEIAVSGPTLALESTAHVTELNVISASFPALSLSVLGGWDASGSFIDASLSSTATLTETMSLAAPFTVSTLSATMTVDERAAAQLGFVSSQITAFGGADAILSTPNFGFTLDGVMRDTYGERVDASLEFITTSISASGTLVETMNATLGFVDTYLSYNTISLSGPLLALSCASSESLSNLIAYAFNVHTHESTTYTNYPFMHIIHIGGKPYGVKANGLYLLEGALDLTTAINGSITTKDSDFGFFNSKHVPQVYLNSDTPTTTRAIVDDVSAGPYPSGFGGRRVVIARGLAGRYWQFEFSGIQKLEGFEATAVLRQRSVK